MKWMVGLGNPGAQYAGTRHNVGFMAVDEAAKAWGISVTQTKFKALVGEGHVRGEKVILMKPMTYMNLSGESIRAMLDFYKLDIQDGLILYDDMDTAFGQIRLRYQGSPRGHNGIKSIIQHTGTAIFNRIRIGISRPVPGTDIANYVLSNFNKEEEKELPFVLGTTVEAMEFSLLHSFEKTMAKYNK